MTVPMIVKKCSNCAVTCWHNPRKFAAKGQEQTYRCTFCGNPPGHRAGDPRRDLASATMTRQQARASLIGLTQAGRIS
jgi:hypothetical protein